MIGQLRLRRYWLQLLAIVASAALAQAAEPWLKPLAAQNVVWDSPSTDSRGSMPLGNGDISLNVWVESSGDLLFYIGKTDAWNSNHYAPDALIKLARIRVSLTPNALPAGAAFAQTLRLADGAIEVREGTGDAAVIMKVWVDANRPAIHVESNSAQPHALRATVELWRESGDTVVPGTANQVLWYHRVETSKSPQLVGWTTGATLWGEGLLSDGQAALKSAAPAKAQAFVICPFTAKVDKVEDWLQQAASVAATVGKAPTAEAWTQHVAWWHAFWDRSWIFADGDKDAEAATSGYLLQRFVTACAGRGAYPVKFNGSIFTSDYLRSYRDKDKQVQKEMVNADYRNWGGMYWFQNTRAMYWPMLQAGDFDMLQPLFKMYSEILKTNAELVRNYYNHDGAYFAETAPFWGGVGKLTDDQPGHYTRHYYTPVLELSAMMLDYVAYTRDEAFARDTLIPAANAGVTFYYEHFPKNDHGKLTIAPANAIEMYWKCTDPLPDIAGLRYVLQGLLALSPNLAGESMRLHWQAILASVPELPRRNLEGKQLLSPAAEYGEKHNSENPELYAIYPFRLYGLGQPDLQLALETFNARLIKAWGCWYQDPVQAAYLGLTDLAKQDTVNVLTHQDKQLRFPAFWAAGHDYAPDEDNGGNGQNAMQLMLLQPVGQRLLLLPAWPATWNVSFRLHAPDQTIVSGEVKSGKLTALTVTPEARTADVEVRQADGTFAKPALP